MDRRLIIGLILWLSAPLTGCGCPSAQRVQIAGPVTEDQVIEADAENTPDSEAECEAVCRSLAEQAGVAANRVTDCALRVYGRRDAETGSPADAAASGEVSCVVTVCSAE